MKKLLLAFVALLAFESPSFGQQATAQDYVQIIRSIVSSLVNDGLESKISRDDHCRPLPADRQPTCVTHMDTAGLTRAKLDQAMTAVENASKSGGVDRRLLKRVDDQIAAYLSIRNFVLLWIDDK